MIVLSGRDPAPLPPDADGRPPWDADG
ncbi:MAG: hypothetical protein JWO38_3154, partial [Gemmataceae bacterium]|nr:hypothetical protein [Gemmataceae bacterium]MDB5308952.1 hypothetical protein [Gemmataceae bacterium]